MLIRSVFFRLIILSFAVLLWGCGGENILTNSKNSEIEDEFDNNSGDETYTLTINSPLPAISIANASSYTVSGSCDPNLSFVTVTVSTPEQSSVVTCANGTFTADLDVTSVTLNPAMVQAVQGVLSDEVSPSPVNDQVAATVAVTTALDINTTNESSYDVSGTCSDDGKQVLVVVGGIAASPQPICSGGAWTAVGVDVSLVPEGSVLITADHSDAVGNAATQVSLSVNKDAIIPTVAVTVSPDINLANVSSYNFSGTCSEDTREVTVSVGGVNPGTQPICTGGAWSVVGLNVSGLLDGVGTVLVLADHDDAAGNDATQASLSISKDVLIPTVAIDASADVNLANVGSYDFSGTCSEGTREITVSVGGVSPGTQPVCTGGTWSVTGLDVTGAAEGSINILADHGDAAGNNAIQASLSINKDAITPTVAITVSPDINLANASSYNFSGTCSEDTREVTVSLGGVSPGAQPICTGGAWSVVGLNVSGLLDGVGTVLVLADHDDAAGNDATQASLSISKDVLIPTVTIDASVDIDLTNASSYDFSGTCSEDTREVTVNLGGVSPGTQPTCTGGTWSVTGLDVTGAAEGSINILADHTDAALNSATQASLAVDKDMTPFMLWASSTQTTGSTNVNLAADDLEWAGIIVSSKYFEVGPINTDEITIKTAGDYKLSLTLPLTSALQRANILAQIKVNSTTINGAVSASSYIRNFSGHILGSNHIDVVLNDLAVNDIVEVQVEIEGLAGTVTISNAAYLFMEPVVADKVFVATATQVTGGTNLNNASLDSLEWTQQKVSSPFAHSDVLNPEQITISTAGNYFVSVNIPMASTVQRASVKSQLNLGGSVVAGSSARQGYIRSASGHNTASTHWQGFLEGVVGGQILEVETVLDGVAGTVTMLPGQAAGVSIEKIESTEFISLSAVDVVAGTNWNQASFVDWAVQNSIDGTNFSHSTGASPEEITVLSDGNYFISYTDSHASTVQRAAVVIDIMVNGSATGLNCSSHYIRASGGHNESSCSLSGMLTGLSSGDIIRVDTSIGGLTGTATSNDDARLFILKK